jgi:hypothetical protein
VHNFALQKSVREKPSYTHRKPEICVAELKKSEIKRKQVARTYIRTQSYRADRQKKLLGTQRRIFQSSFTASKKPLIGKLGTQSSGVLDF